MMDLGGADFRYPVHSPNFSGSEWCTLFTNWHRSNQEETEPINVYNERTRRQVVIMVATNSVADDITVKAVDMFRRISPDSHAQIIRVHAVHIEKQVVERAYLKIADQVPASNDSSGHNENPANEEKSEYFEFDDMDAIADLRTAAEYVNVLTQHYSLTRPDTVSSFEGVSDPRLKEISTSLGAAMLGVAGKIPGSPWAIPGLGPYHDFDSFWQYRQYRIEAEDEEAFQKACQSMKRDALRIADIVIGTPAVITAPTILTCLHPSFVAIDEASMIRETDLHAAFAWFYPISFGLFGDSRQLGPHSSTVKDQNPFYKQVRTSLLERMSTAGHMAAFLRHQQRMTGDIQRLSRDVFYSDITMINAVLDPEDKAKRLASWNMRQYKVKSNALMLDVSWTIEESIGTSFANAGNRKVVLDLTRKLIGAGLFEPKDFVILVGYEIQSRFYIKDLHELAQSDPRVAWSSVRAFKIDSFQGNEADLVIFDYVRTGKKHGFVGAFRRLNVACSRGRYGFYLVASARTLKTVERFGYKSPKVHKFFESCNAKATLDAPADVGTL